VPSFLNSYVPYLLERASQLLSERFHAELAEEGIEVSDWRILAVLLEASPLPVNDLSDRTMLPQPTTSHALTRLEARKCVARRAGAEDKRVRLVELTPTGRQLAKKLEQRADRLERKALATVDPALASRVEADLRLYIAALES
jgi:MarR family transcriptional regulator, organic hydroperoxide resistance regulator